MKERSRVTLKLTLKSHTSFPSNSYDGRVYESLYEQTLYEPLNRTDIADGYYKHLQFIMHPERRENGLAQQAPKYTRSKL